MKRRGDLARARACCALDEGMRVSLLFGYGCVFEVERIKSEVERVRRWGGEMRECLPCRSSRKSKKRFHSHPF